jgi:hypothetical protein
MIAVPSGRIPAPSLLDVELARQGHFTGKTEMRRDERAGRNNCRDGRSSDSRTENAWVDGELVARIRNGHRERTAGKPLDMAGLCRRRRLSTRRHWQKSERSREST